LITFFRKVRHKLLKENRLRKYLTYAIREILLVMIEILLALQVNNWNQKRQDKLATDKLLIKVLKELHHNILNSIKFLH